MKLLLSLEWDPGMVNDTFTPRVGRNLITSVRDVRRLGLSPILALSPSEFMVLLDHWPQFYLAGPVIAIHTRGTFYSWLRRLFIRKKRTPPPLIQFDSEPLDRIRGQMLRMQAIPVDGVWVPVSILEDETVDDNPN